jgi:hypothetical protein
MKKDLLHGFHCEIQQKSKKTQFHEMHWSAEMFTFNQVGVELSPGNYIITLYSDGEEVVSTTINIRKIQTILGMWVGGLNPQKPHGQNGIMIYKGNVKSLVEKTNGKSEQGNDV